MGEVTYVWGDPTSPIQQIALSSLVQAMASLRKFAVARYVGRDGADPKMVVLAPSNVGDIDCLLMVRMPFADDVRKYTFASLDVLVNKKGERVVEHPYIPTEEQLEAMDSFVDAMDLSTAGEKDEDGCVYVWWSYRDHALMRLQESNILVHDTGCVQPCHSSYQASHLPFGSRVRCHHKPHWPTA